MRGHEEKYPGLDAQEREEILRRFEAAKMRRPQRKQLNGMVAITRLMICAGPDDGPDGETIKRSIPQIARTLARENPELGFYLAKAGRPLTCRELHDLYGNNVRNWLRYLQEIGYLVEGRTYDLARNGEGEGIVIRVSSDLRLRSSAVRAQRTKRRRDATRGNTRSHRRSFSGALFSPPSGVGRSKDLPTDLLRGRVAPTLLIDDGKQGTTDSEGATAEPGSGDSDTSAAGTASGGAHNRIIEKRGELEQAVASGADPLRVALFAFQAALGRRSKPFSFKRRGEQLRRALARGDRYGAFGKGGQGLGFARLLDMLESQAADEAGRNTDGDRPATLAWFIAVLEAETSDWRHAARHRAGKCAGENHPDPRKRCRYQKRYHPRSTGGESERSEGASA